MKPYIWILFLLSGTAAQAQKKNERWGYLRDSITREPIVLASITNLNTQTTVMTSASGRFKIELQENQVLSFAAVGYYFDTIHYNKQFLLQDTLSLFLSPLAHSLGNVTVTTRGLSRYQLDSIERRKEFLQDIVDYTIPTVSKANSGAGIALNLDRFSRHEKNKRKAFAFFESNEKEAYINYRFPASVVTQYSGLKDTELQQFMQQYRPTSEWLRRNRSEEDIKYYINEKLKLFFKRG
ncbi:MAG TPA: hypothetical protein VGE25_08810 [Sediminibacterium sp.]